MLRSTIVVALMAISTCVLAQDNGAQGQAPDSSAHRRGRHSRGGHRGGVDASPSTFVTKQKAGSSDAALQPFTSNGILYQPVIATVTQPNGNAPSTPTTAVQAPQGPAAPPASSKTPALPAAPPASSSQPLTGDSSLNAQVLSKIMPSSSSCSGAKHPAECITAADAAPLIAQSYTKYKITSKGAQAAILALIAVESGELKFNQHYSGDAPALTGQGTRNMMGPAFVLEYGKALGVAGGDALSVMNGINKNQADSMASAAWFLATKCPGILQQFASSPDAAYSQYITSPGCIGTTMAGDRQSYWTAAKAALGV